MTAFLHEDEVLAAYDAAETVVRMMVEKDTILLVENQEPAKSKMIRAIARDVADSVMRTQAYAIGDITDIPGVTVERV